MRLKLALVALLANATWHLFNAYSPNFRFKDSVQNATQFRGQSNDEDLADKIMALAAEYDIPLAPADLSVTHQGSLTTVHVSYVRRIELAPRYFYPWPFSFSVEALNLATIPESKPR
jgi:hypothetical protein